MARENKLGKIGVGEANTIIGELSLSACEGGPRVTLIMFPERMNTEAPNKLLISLEEPKPDTFFILISQNPTKIIPTILSRCRIIEVPPMEQKILASRIKEECDISIEEALLFRFHLAFVKSKTRDDLPIPDEMIGTSCTLEELGDIF